MHPLTQNIIDILQKMDAINQKSPHFRDVVYLTTSLNTSSNIEVMLSFVALHIHDFNSWYKEYNGIDKSDFIKTLKAGVYQLITEEVIAFYRSHNQQ